MMSPVRLILWCMVPLLLSAVPDGVKWFESEAEGFKEARASGKPVYVLLWDPKASDGKAHLKDLERREIAKHLEKFVCVRIDATTNKDARTKYDPKALPFSHFMKSDGTPIKSIHGKIASSTFAKQIEEALAKVTAPPLQAKPPERKEIKPGPLAGKPIVHGATCPNGCDVCRTAIEKALALLVAKQKNDGRWERIERATPPDGMKEGSEYISSIDHIDVFLTAICGLALMSEGSTIGGGKHQKPIQKAAAFLMSCVRADGNVSKTDNMQDVYQIYANFQTPYAALFLAEVAQTDRSPELRKKLEAVARYIESEQEKGGGWGYGYRWKNRPAGDKYSRPLVAVAIGNLVALGQLREAGVKVSDDALKRGAEYLARCRHATGGYLYSETMPIGATPGRTAGVLHALRRSGASGAEVLKRDESFLRQTFRQSEAYAIWMWFSHFYTALALREVGGFAEYRKAYVDGFLATQQEDGSWVDPDGMGGTLFATAACAMILQMDLGHLPLMHGKKGPEGGKPDGAKPAYLPMPSKESRVKVFKPAAGGGYRVDLILSAEEKLDDRAKGALKTCMEKVNAILVDLTDGQMSLNKIDIHDGKAEWERADVRLCAKAFPGGLHGQTVVGTDVKGGKEGKRIGEFVELPLRAGAVAWESDEGARVIAHELGHYLFGLEDEYHRTTGEISCRECLMGGASLRVTEFCRPGTHKGDCWSTMKALYPNLKIPVREDAGPWHSPTPTVIAH